ncbi:MAG: class I SAM-dependent methyltransferase [Verrucomicrobiota bacterium]
MFEPNVEKVLSLIKETDVVLDIGAWARPFNRANYVVDAEPYETRRTTNAQGGGAERVTKATWIQRDLCDRAPFPFGDKQFDFVICSHTLEDIRDPLWVCGEMIRVGKRGYIEVPSRVLETCVGVQSPRFAGYSHHRWLIDIEGNQISFLMKTHRLHESAKYHLTERFLKKLPIDRHFQWLFWEGTFEYRELRPWPMEEELERFVKAHQRPGWW